MSDHEKPPKPEILIDDDWKSQAQAEKQKMAEAEAEAAKAKSDAPDGAPGASGLPPADFSALVGMLVTQAIMYLGGVADKESGGVVFEPELGRFYIDLLAVVEEKTKGNISDEEAKDVSAALNELRMRFVELSRMMAQQIASGAAPAPADSSTPQSPSL